MPDTTFQEGDYVLITATADHGVVVAAHMDEDKEWIEPPNLAVEVENGQGTWGFDPSELQHSSPTAWDREESEPCEKGTPGCSVRHSGSRHETNWETW